MASQRPNIFLLALLVYFCMQYSLCSALALGESCPPTGCTGLNHATCISGGCFCDQGFVQVDDYTCQASTTVGQGNSSPVLAASTELCLSVFAYWVVTVYIR